jgi:tryptophanase
VAEVVADLYRHATAVPGLRMTYAPEQLRFFQARFEPLAPFSVGGIEGHALELSA